MSALAARHLFTTTEYHRLLETGFFTEDDRVELIDGEIRNMSPIGPKHAGCVNKLLHLLHQKIGRIAIVAAQNPLWLNEYSEPQPDISLLKQRVDFYMLSHPTPQDTLVAIEVADSSLDDDRQVKLPKYAAAGIPEAWLVDLVNDRIEIYALPAEGIYQEIRIVLRHQKIISRTLPQLKLKAADILG
jgi:Uma2 family endonuclease